MILSLKKFECSLIKSKYCYGLFLMHLSLFCCQRFLYKAHILYGWHQEGLPLRHTLFLLLMQGLFLQIEKNLYWRHLRYMNNFETFENQQIYMHICFLSFSMSLTEILWDNKFFHSSVYHFYHLIFEMSMPEIMKILYHLDDIS